MEVEVEVSQSTFALFFHFCIALLMSVLKKALIHEFHFTDRGDDNDGEKVHLLDIARVETASFDVQPGESCSWKWRVVSHSIDCTVTAGDKILRAVERVAEYPSSAATTPRGSRKTAGWQTGTYSNPSSASEAVTVTLTFDNSFSWARHKQVQYCFTSC